MKFKCLTIFFVLFILIIAPNNQSKFVYAKDLETEVQDQLNSIDFSEIEQVLSQLHNLPDEYNFFGKIKDVLSGNYDISYDGFIKYIFSIFFSLIKELLPSFLTVIVISLLLSILNATNVKYLGDSVSDLVCLIGNISILLLFSINIVSAYRMTVNFIDTVFNINQAISPILLTLMVASGGTISASVYRPVVVMLSSGVVNIIKNIVLPIILAISALNVLAVIIPQIKFNAFLDFLSSLIKWIFGITIAVFGIFLSIQGFASSIHDGISLKAAKYAISNSIPIVGGFLSSGFDLVICGSVLIKNAVGISSIFFIFYILLSPLSYLLSMNLLLKLSGGLTEMIGDSQSSNLCMGISKGITYFIVCILMVFFMLFLLILLIIFSANAFV